MGVCTKLKLHLSIWNVSSSFSRATGGWLSVQHSLLYSWSNEIVVQRWSLLRCFWAKIFFFCWHAFSTRSFPIKIICRYHYLSCRSTWSRQQIFFMMYYYIFYNSLGKQFLRPHWHILQCKLANHQRIRLLPDLILFCSTFVEFYLSHCWANISYWIYMHEGSAWHLK